MPLSHYQMRRRALRYSIGSLNCPIQIQIGPTFIPSYHINIHMFMCISNTFLFLYCGAMRCPVKLDLQFMPHIRYGTLRAAFSSALRPSRPSCHRFRSMHVRQCPVVGCTSKNRRFIKRRQAWLDIFLSPHGIKRILLFPAYLNQSFAVSWNKRQDEIRAVFPRRYPV
jgi:hypothetical protein